MDVAERELSTTSETCEQLRCSRDTLYRLIADGSLETVKIGRRRLVFTRSIRELIDRGRRCA